MDIPKQLVKDAIQGLEDALEYMVDECDCEDATVERDTGALIHDEEECQSFRMQHIEVTLAELEKRLASLTLRETDQPTTECIERAKDAVVSIENQ